MTKKTRTILFLTCAILFIVACPLTVMYSQGYRVSFEQGSIKVSKTGGIFVKAYPKQVEVKIEEATAAKKTINERTDFLFGSLLVENLFPKKYHIEIKKDGYQAWRKTLEVKEKEVAGIKNIVLFQEARDFPVFASGLKDVWFYPDQKKIIMEEADKEGWSLKSYDLAGNVKSHLIDDSDLSTKKSELISLDISPDYKTINLKASTSEGTRYFRIDLEKSPPSIIKLKSAPLSTGTELATEKYNNDSYALDKSGNLLKNKEKISEKPFEIKKGADYVLKISSQYIFLKEDSILYKFSGETRSFEKFADNIRDFKFSPGQKTMAYLSDYEIWLYFLKDKESEPVKKSGESMSLFRISEKIKDFFWLNEDYLLLNIGGTIKTIEIDNRDKVQTWDLGAYEDPKMVFSDFDKKIYVLSKDKLYCSDVFLP